MQIGKTIQAYNHIRYQLGYSKRGGDDLTDSEIKALSVVSQDLRPTDMKHYLISFPITLEKLVEKENSVKYFKKNFLDPDTKSLLYKSCLQFLESLIREYSDKNEAENLLIEYSFCSSFIYNGSLAHEHKGKITKPSAIFDILIFIFEHLGIEFLKYAIENLKIEDNDLKSDQTSVIITAVSAAIKAAVHFSDEEYDQLIEILKSIIVPAVSNINQKNLGTLIEALSKGLNVSLSFSRSKKLFDAIKELAEKETGDNKTQYLHVLLVACNSANYIIPDEIYALCRDIIQ